MNLLHKTLTSYQENKRRKKLYWTFLLKQFIRLNYSIFYIKRSWGLYNTYLY